MTIGQLFKQKRLESGRSLEQYAALTKIHIKILSALEEDSYGGLPARAFTRGFIVNYARALKLNAEELLKEHHDFLEQHFAERRSRDKGHQGYVFEGKEIEQNRRWLVIGATIALIFAGATLFVFKPQNHKHKEQHKEFQTEVDANGETSPESLQAAIPVLKGSPSLTVSAQYTPSPLYNPIAIAPVETPVLSEAKTSESSSGANAPSTPESTKEDKLNKGNGLSPSEAKIKVVLQAKEDCWVRYKSDDKAKGMIILRKDRVLVIKAKEHLIFETTRPNILRYKTPTGYRDVESKTGEVLKDSSIVAFEGGALGSTPVPEKVPLPATR